VPFFLRKIIRLKHIDPFESGMIFLIVSA